ncbi:hypothetical protein BKA61DRAFT_78302 [Leptodontidium sp. MPI-SDFR-AT-0119]|nr:hypothetical protein BKA61DRAFT_78302 [Leptodontidium sp. MPI-SDFR-AT-0119]
MTRLQQTQTRWSKSFPTVVTTPISAYTCSYERGLKSCKKQFSRQCDLRQHQKNHIRPSHCPKCAARFPSPKDLERHDNTVHNNTLKYFCPYEWCRDSIKLELEGWFVWGFRRKDHWLKHLRDEHSTSKDEVKALQKAGIPMARLEEGVWVDVLPKATGVGPGVLTQGTSTKDY